MIKASVPKDLEEAFRRQAMERYGFSKGAVSKALEAAVRLWLRYDYEPRGEEEVNNKAYESIRDELESKYPGMYAVIAEGRLLSVHASLREVPPAKAGQSHRLVFKVGERPVAKVRLGWRTRIKPVGRT